MSSLDYLESIWSQTKNKLQDENNFRSLISISSSQNNSLLNFSCNDYLGLRNDVRLCDAGTLSVKNSGSGCGSSRSVMQTDNSIDSLEKFFCEKTGFKHAVFFPSGFTANLSFFDVLSSYSFENISCEFFLDHRCHASLFYSLKSKEIHSQLFHHNNLNHLELKLKNSSAKAKIIVFESLFSMDGDFFAQEGLVTLCEKYNALIFIDESHSFGLYGEKGTGWVHQYPQLKKYLLASSYGCGKAVGVCGGFLATNSELFKERIIQKSKFFIYSTAISPYITGAVEQSLRIIFSSEGDSRREKLFKNISYFKNELIKQNYLFPFVREENHYSPIFPLVFYENNIALQKEKHFLNYHIFVKAIRPPSVPNRTARLRVCLNMSHTKEEMDYFISLLKISGEKKL